MFLATKILLQVVLMKVHSMLFVFLFISKTIIIQLFSRNSPPPSYTPSAAFADVELRQGDIVKGKKIGEGAFGVVFLGTWFVLLTFYIYFFFFFDVFFAQMKSTIGKAKKLLSKSVYRRIVPTTRSPTPTTTRNSATKS